MRRLTPFYQLRTTEEPVCPYAVPGATRIPPMTRRVSGARGIGAAMARSLAADGADVAIGYSASPDKAKVVVTELEALGVRAKALQAQFDGDPGLKVLLAPPLLARLRSSQHEGRGTVTQGAR